MKIAIDGPAGSGKSTISKILAQKFNLTYIDTGAMYRSCAFIANKYNLQGQDLINKINESKIILTPNNKVFLLINNVKQNITEEIRRPEISNLVSKIASIPEIREIMTSKQKQLIQNDDVIMDGRDIGTVVMPNANFKFFLTASDIERAKRRYNELVKKDNSIEFEKVYKEMQLRDQQDISRKTAPLKKADDAFEIDTTGLTIDEVVEKISKIINENF